MASKKAIDALRNVTQARGYTAAEEETAKKMLSKYESSPVKESPSPTPPFAGHCYKDYEDLVSSIRVFREELNNSFQRDMKMWEMKMQAIKKQAEEIRKRKMA